MAEIDNKLERIPLGSGMLYTVLFNGTIPEDAVIETDENNLGRVQGGASLEYKPKFYECSDDLGLVSREILTEEEIIMKSGRQICRLA